MAEHIQENEEPKPNSDDMFKDAEVRAERDRTMNKMKWGPILNGVSRALGIIGGPVFGFGLMAMLGFTNIAPSMMGPALTATIVGGVMSVASIAIDYLASRVYQSCGFDHSEVAAKSNAKHLVKELESHNMVIACKDKVGEKGFDTAERKDGKSWVAVTQVSSGQQGITLG